MSIFGENRLGTIDSKGDFTFTLPTVIRPSFLSKPANNWPEGDNGPCIEADNQEAKIRPIVFFVVQDGLVVGFLVQASSQRAANTVLGREWKVGDQATYKLYADADVTVTGYVQLL